MHEHRVWWAWSLRFRRYRYSQKWPNFSFGPWAIYSPWSSKILINRNWIKKFMQVGIDISCMYTEFGGHGLSGFGDTTTLKKRPNFPFGPWAIVHGPKGLALESNNLYRNLYLASLKPKSIDILCQNLSTAAEHLDPQNVPVKALVGSNN